MMIRTEESFTTLNECSVCLIPLQELQPEEGGHYVVHGVYERQRRPRHSPPYLSIHTSFIQACAKCAAMEPALAEAKANGWRFMEILPRRRCPCGRVLRDTFDNRYQRALCNRCQAEMCMLDKQLRAARRVQQLLVELRRELRGNENRGVARDVDRGDRRLALGEDGAGGGQRDSEGGLGVECEPAGGNQRAQAAARGRQAEGLRAAAAR